MARRSIENDPIGPAVPIARVMVEKLGEVSIGPGVDLARSFVDGNDYPDPPSLADVMSSKHEPVELGPSVDLAGVFLSKD